MSESKKSAAPINWSRAALRCCQCHALMSVEHFEGGFLVRCRPCDILGPYAEAALDAMKAAWLFEIGTVDYPNADYAEADAEELQR